MRVTVKGFRQWLEEQRPQAVVGLTLSATGCPVARYTEVLGVAEPLVRWGKYYNGRENKRLPAPLTRFIRLVDGQVLVGLTAARALNLLAQAAKRPSR